jgi:hypothetical protein
MANGQLTLLQIRDLCKQESDMVNSSFLSDAEWNSYINQSYYELYDLLVQKYGNDYFVQTPYTFITDGVSKKSLDCANETILSFKSFHNRLFNKSATKRYSAIISLSKLFIFSKFSI